MLHESHFLKRDLILNLISHLGPISRTRLISLSDYRPATVSEIIKDLLEEGLIIETGSVSAGHGRKRVMLEINSRHLCGLGLSFTQSAVGFLVAQVDGVILEQAELPIHRGEPKEQLMEKICSTVLTLLSHFSGKRMVGIGIGNPPHDPTGYAREQSLLLNYSHYNDWIDLGLKPRLEALTGLTVQNYSSVTLPAVAEQRFGTAQGAQNFLCVELTNGIGAAICCNGIPVAGHLGVAGELGHTVIDFGAPRELCYCGKPGCVEASTAYPGLVAQIRQALEKGVFSSLKPDQALTVETLRQALAEGDRLTIHYVKDTARRIGVVIANAVNLLNPELVVLYGFMTELGDAFLRALEESLRENVVPVAGDFQVRVSPSQQTLLPLGAVAEVFSQFLHSQNFRWVYQLPRQNPEA